MAVNFCMACGQKLEADWKHCPQCSALIDRTEVAPSMNRARTTRREIVCTNEAQARERRVAYRDEAQARERRAAHRTHAQASQNMYASNDPAFEEFWKKKCKNEKIVFSVAAVVAGLFAVALIYGILEAMKTGAFEGKGVLGVITCLAMLVFYPILVLFEVYGAAKMFASSWEKIKMASFAGLFNPVVSFMIGFPLIFKMIFGCFAGFVWGPMFVFRMITKRPVVTEKRAMKLYMKE